MQTPTKTAQAAKTERLFYLDNIKIFLTILVIFHHAGQAYGDGGAWAYKPSLDEYVDGLWRFFSVNAAFFMGFFFMISGYFIPKSFDQQGAKIFTIKKIVRLGIPTLFIVVLLSTLTKQIEFAHTWYLEHLLFYSLVYVILRLATKRTISLPKTKQPTLITLLLLACGLSVAEYFVREVSPQDKWVWLLGFLRTEPAHLPQYVLMFVLGIFAYRQKWFSNMSKTTGLTSLLVGIILSLIIYFDIHIIDIPWAIYESFLCISLCFGLIYLFREVFNKSNSVIKWLSAQAYGAYVFHLMIMLGIQNAFDKLDLGGGINKLLFIGLVSTIVSFTITWLVRLITPVKKVL